MKIRQESIHGAKGKPRRNEQAGLPMVGAHPAMLASSSFKGPHHGRPDCDNLPTCVLRTLDRLYGIAPDIDPLCAHLMVVDTINRHRLERTDADMQRHFRQADPSIGKTCQQRRGEVKAGRRRGNRPFLMRKDRLIPGAVPFDRWPLYIRGQWHVPVYPENV